MSRDRPTRPFPLPPTGSMGPPPDYEQLREECPVARVRLPVDEDGWLITRYPDVRDLLADRRLIRPTVNEWPLDGRHRDTGPKLTTMMEIDGPRHANLHRIVAHAFRPRAVRRRLPAIRRLAEQLLDDLARSGPPSDWVRSFAEPFPLAVMCDFVGVPYEEAPRFAPAADAALGALLTLEQARSVTAHLRGYAGELVERKRHQPADDVLSDLVRRRDSGELDHEQLLSFVLSMVIAGYRTTTMFLANAAVLLFQQPEVLHRLRAEPDTTPAVVQELLRHLPIMNGTIVLQARTDFELRGCDIRAGDAVLPIIPAANRDPNVFARADRFDPDRTSNPHLAFGRGPHACAGLSLARAELAVALEALLNRFPNVSLAVDEEQIPWEENSPAKSPLELPITW